MKIIMIRLFAAILVLFLAAPSWAASPVVETGNSTTDTDGDTTVLNMPAGIVSGDLLLQWCAHFSGSTILTETGGSSWTRIAGGIYGGSNVTYSLFAKIAAGSDTLTTDGFAGGDTACAAHRISGHSVSNVSTDITISSVSSVDTASPDPPITNPGVSDDYLFIEAFYSRLGPTFTTASTGYTTSVVASSGVSNSVSIATARKAATASSDDPDAATISFSSQTHAFVIAIPGAGAVAGDTTGNSSGVMLLLGM